MANPTQRAPLLAGLLLAGLFFGGCRTRGTISPMVWWSSQLSGEVRDTAVKSDLFVWALTVSYAF